MAFKITTELEPGDEAFAPTEVCEVRITGVTPLRSERRGEVRLRVAAVELSTGAVFHCDCGEQTRWYLPA
jgi:hypothetical protein